MIQRLAPRARRAHDDLVLPDASGHTGVVEVAVRLAARSDGGADPRRLDHSRRARPQHVPVGHHRHRPMMEVLSQADVDLLTDWVTAGAADSAGGELTGAVLSLPTRGRDKLLPRQIRLPHQERVDRAGAQAAFADRPHHQRLAAAHVAGGEHVGQRGLVVRACWRARCRAGRDRPPSIFNRPSCTGCTKPIASSTSSRVEVEFGAGQRLELFVDLHAVQLLHLAVRRRRISASARRIRVLRLRPGSTRSASSAASSAR